MSDWPARGQGRRALWALALTVGVLVAGGSALAWAKLGELVEEPERDRRRLGALMACAAVDRHLVGIETLGSTEASDAVRRRMRGHLAAAGGEVRTLEALQAGIGDAATAAPTARLVRAWRDMSASVPDGDLEPAVRRARQRLDQLARLHRVRHHETLDRRVRDTRSGRWLLLGAVSLAGTGFALAFVRLRRTVNDVTSPAAVEHRWLRQVLEVGAVEVCLFEPEGLGLIAANPAAVANSGYSAEEIRRLTLSGLVPQLGAAEQRLAPLLGGSRDRLILDTVHRRRDDSRYPVQAVFQIIEWEGRRALVEFACDISSLERMRERIRQGQRMEAIGQIAGGIAHDFNNLLTVIIGNAERLAQRVDGEEVHIIHQAAESAAVLTRQLLRFGLRSISTPSPLDLQTVLDELAQLLRRVIPETIELRIVPAGEQAVVRVDRGEMHQAIMNLCINARDAMPRGGRLTIESEVVDLAGDVAAERGRSPGRFVVLSVTDTGVGMDAEIRARAMEPFFTTKPAGEGTGMGLATVFGMAEQNHGFVDIDSQPGRGTCVRLFLPRVAGEAGPVPEPAPAAPVSGGGESVLVVEDEVEIGLLVERVLTRAGYEVEVAKSPELALRAAAQGDARVDLLLTDLVMPGMGGDELAQRVRELHPQARVLFMSGYVPGSVLPVRVLERAVVLEKPFTAAGLLQKVRALLEGSLPDQDAAARA